MSAQDDLARIRWQCRRGMLELDHLLSNFFDGYYAQLTVEEQQDFINLLTYPDQQLYEWLTGRTKASAENLQRLIERIRNPFAISS